MGLLVLVATPVALVVVGLTLVGLIVYAMVFAYR